MPRPSERVDIHRIEFEVPWPPHTAYAYFLPTEEPILIDAGAPGEEGWAALANGLEAAGYAPEDVEHLLITHPHTDHDGQVSSLVDAADPTVYAPEGIRDRLSRDPDDLASVVRRNAAAAGVPDPESAVERAVDSLRRNRSCLPPEDIDVDVAFGDPLDAGAITFTPIHVPGHQANQAAFLADGDLFAGDTLIEPFRPAALHVGFDRGYEECIDAFYDGLDRLATHDIDRVYPGHGPVFEDAGGAIEQARNDLDSLVASCRRTLSELGRATAYEVTETRIDDPRRMEFSVFETVGSLARLERRGETVSTAKNGVRTYRS
ncbi:MAG: glyoxylase-like metal-dependent hydrolase (beta-lactamase superfamily II) [Natronomonas sp.]|jgi:glyoxylase-like metal-dependent hydrolase (beta-lactamase superfamily II)|uniref:MBL fold metallo-hydrolase n=1 Tax=Natronomonas sp. TaxID=2184060 RepID=UPI0039897361